MIILAPHPDDELIGCWSYLSRREIRKVIYLFSHDDPIRHYECLACADMFGFDPVFETFSTELVERHNLVNEEVLMPSFHDSHPDHRFVNRAFRSLPKAYFYSIDLDRAEGKHVLPDFSTKKTYLDRVYPSQTELWENNASYYLFECVKKRDFKELRRISFEYLGQIAVVVSDFYTPEILNQVLPKARSLQMLLDYAVSNGATSVELTLGNRILKI